MKGEKMGVEQGGPSQEEIKPYDNDLHMKILGVEGEKTGEKTSETLDPVFFMSLENVRKYAETVNNATDPAEKSKWLEIMHGQLQLQLDHISQKLGR